MTFTSVTHGLKATIRVCTVWLGGVQEEYSKGGDEFSGGVLRRSELSRVNSRNVRGRESTSPDCTRVRYQIIHVSCMMYDLVMSVDPPADWPSNKATAFRSEHSDMSHFAKCCANSQERRKDRNN